MANETSLIFKVEKKDDFYLTTVNGVNLNEIDDAVGNLLLTVMKTMKEEGGKTDEEICATLLGLQTWAMERYFEYYGSK